MTTLRSLRTPLPRLRAAPLLAALPLVLLHLAPVRLSAQAVLEYSDKCESAFREALAKYDGGAYREAEVGFDLLIRDFPSGQRITAAWVMKGKALYRLNENLESARTMKTFLSRFPSSSYVPDAELTLGLVYVRIERYEEAIDMFLSALRSLTPSSPGLLAAGIDAALDSTADAHLNTASLRRFLARASTVPERSFLWLKLAEKEAPENTVEAAIALDSLAEHYPGHRFLQRAADLRLRIAARSSVKLGVLLPLMRGSEPSAAKEVGNEVDEGILYAAELFAQDPHVRVSVSLITKDTEREPRLATRGAEELAGDSEVIGILGPVFSTSVTSAAAVANARGVPLVTPTANADGIAAMGRYIFQANPDYDTRGRAMARYAVQVRGFQTLAVLAPADTYAKFLVAGFVKEATRLGANVISTEWYQRGTSDLKPQLANIRRAGMVAGADAKLAFGGKMRPESIMKFLDLGVPLKRVDSLMSTGSTVSARALLGPRARALLDSVGIPVVFDESRVDSLEYPVEAIDALYAPISGAEEIGIVSSQIVYYNFHVQLMGSGEWNSFSELNANRRYCNGVLFESDTHIDTTGGGYASFADGFTARFKKRPTNNALFGYDTARLVLALIGGGATTREALQKALAGVHDYRGYHSRISFGPARVNGWLTIDRYGEDEIRSVYEMNLERPQAGGGSGESVQK